MKNQTNGKNENPFHQTDEQYIEARKRLMKTAIANNEITEDDCELINKFLTGKSTKIGAKRAYKYTYTLVGFRKNDFVTVPYLEMTKDDFDAAIERLNSHGFKRNTLRDYIDFLKRFTLWMIDNDYSTIKPGDRAEREIQKLSPGRRDKMTKTKASIYTPEEIESMIQAAPGVMWKTLICTIFDGAFRPQEIGKLTWGQVKIEKHKASINTSEKTGRPRLVPCYRAFPYLKQWANQYPGERSKDAYVFLNEYNRPLHYNVISYHVKEIGESIGISRDRLKLHNFRHSAITDMQRRKVNDSIIQRICWGGESDMLATYSHLDDADADKAIAESLGVKAPDDTPRHKLLEPKQCPNPTCGAIVPATYEYCPECGEAITEAAKSEKKQADNSLETLIKDPKFKEQLIKYIQNIP
jgi:integrase/recombinase XerD